jgi:predicted Zn finger-like uncharacterized protein
MEKRKDMKIQCPKCKTSYRIDDEKIPEGGAKVRCKKCETKFVVKRQDNHAASRSTSGDVSPPQPPLEKQTDKKTSSESKGGPTASQQDTSLKGIDGRIDEYLKKGDQDAAAKLILDQIKTSAEGNDFTKAEELLEKMYEATPMALNEVVKAGEIIEEAKGKAIDNNHLSMWSELYNLLGTNEVNEVYFAMKKKTLSENETLFKQGENNSNLYFLEEGTLRVFFYDNNTSQDTPIVDLVPGDIANTNSFLAYSITTSTMVAMNKTRVSYLEKEILEKWKEKNPGIEKKLSSFCGKKETISGLIERSDMEPRAHKRVKVNLTSMIQLLDEAEKPIRMAFKVMIYDISMGGMSYIVKQSQVEEAGRLLGNTLIMQTIYGENDAKRKVTRKGKIVAVRLRPFDESSVHIQFKKPLEEETMKEIEQLFKNK